MGGGGGYGGHRTGGSQGDSDADREKMRDVLDASLRVELTQKEPKDPEIVLTGDQNKKLAFYTDGRKLDKPTDENYQEIAAHWDGTKLVTDEKGAHGGKLSRTYELAPDGLQLWEEVHITRGKSDTPITVRFVYDAEDESGTRGQ
jgi:hypothetical protein